MEKVQINPHPIPCSFTVSRATGEITHVEYAMPTKRQYLYYCKTLLQLYGLDDLAELIPVGGIPEFHKKGAPEDPEEEVDTDY